MNDNLQVQNGHASAFLSICFAAISWFTPEHMDLLIKASAGLASVATATMAVRYYYWATKEAKKKFFGRKKNE